MHVRSKQRRAKARGGGAPAAGHRAPPAARWRPPAAPSSAAPAATARRRQRSPRAGCRSHPLIAAAPGAWTWAARRSVRVHPWRSRQRRWGAVAARACSTQRRTDQPARPSAETDVICLAIDGPARSGSREGRKESRCHLLERARPAVRRRCRARRRRPSIRGPSLRPVEEQLRRERGVWLEAVAAHRLVGAQVVEGGVADDAAVRARG